MRLLVTRPEPDGSRTAAALRARGHEVLLAPLLRIEPVSDAAIGAGPWAAVAVTSVNAVNALAAHPDRDRLRRLPCFAVGARTAAAAAALFADVRAAEGDVGALAALLEAAVEDHGNPVLYLAGADRAGDLEARLAAGGLAVRTVVMYRAVAASRLPAAVRDAIAAGQLDGVLHFSRRTADTFLAVCAIDRLESAAARLSHFCLSAQVAAPLVNAGVTVLAAARPDQQSLLDLIDHNR